MKLINEEIEREVCKTLEVLDEIQPVEAHHLFRVQLMQRIDADLEQKSSGRVVSRFDCRLAYMVLLLVVNLVSAFVSIQQNADQSMAHSVQLADIQSDDYPAQEFAYYDQTTSYEHRLP